MKSKERIKQLESINTLLHHDLCQGQSPRGQLISGALVSFVIAGCVAEWGLPAFLADGIWGETGVLLMFGAAGAIMLLVGLGNDGRSWDEMLEQEVADYDPLDRDGYEALRAKAKEDGHLDRDALSAWLKLEQERLKHPFVQG